MSNVLTIKNLVCSYPNGRPVLEIQNLEIPYGKLVFIIGRSGIGKSTFIETLGLMNKTIVSTEKTSIGFFPDPMDTEKIIELKGAWSLSNGDLSNLRRLYFSFIFQQTNLMTNFSTGENMMVSRLIEKEQAEVAKKVVLQVMDQLSLDRSLFDKKITHLSGGQRQRLAFVRAITANFTILFGDEPTGNLDRNTAEELMQVLKQQIQNKKRTGIIVSHDLHLALKFANLIVPITQENRTGNQQGILQNENILENKNGIWYSKNGNEIISPINHLSRFLL